MVVAGVERADVHGCRDERAGTGTDGDGSTAPANTRVSLAARDSRWWSLRPGVGQGDRGSRRYRVRLEHVPQKWEPVLRKRTCSNKELEQDDDSKKSHPALGFANVRIWQILLQKSFCTRHQNLFWLYRRFTCKDVGDLIA